MISITLQLPEESLVALHWNEAEAGNSLRLVAAIKLFELGYLSSGAAANLAGLP
ncbi:MAG: small protein, partial [Thiotrichaceae bacterium IS1]